MLKSLFDSLVKSFFFFKLNARNFLSTNRKRLNLSQCQILMSFLLFKQQKGQAIVHDCQLSADSYWTIEKKIFFFEKKKNGYLLAFLSKFCLNSNVLTGVFKRSCIHRFFKLFNQQKYRFQQYHKKKFIQTVSLSSK